MIDSIIVAASIFTLFYLLRATHNAPDTDFEEAVLPVPENDSPGHAA